MAETADWELVIERLVDGVPKAQPRCRSTRRGHVYTPPVADAWKAAVRLALPHTLEPLAGPLKVRIEFLLHRPRSLSVARWGPGLVRHAVKPDADNLAKAVLDALTGSWWHDDAQVQVLEITKYYQCPGGRPGAWVTIWRQP